VWDIGGQDSLRTFWHTYYTNTSAIIVVIDSTDKARLHIAKAELHKMAELSMVKDASILVYANKQDVHGALSAALISEALNLAALKDRPWHIQGCCALTGDGLYEGLDWVVSRVS
jgi:ADP-ribosylation factor-like protein 5B